MAKVSSKNIADSFNHCKYVGKNYYEPDNKIPLNQWFGRRTNSNWWEPTKFSYFSLIEYETIIDLATSCTSLSDNKEDDDLGESDAFPTISKMTKKCQKLGIFDSHAKLLFISWSILDILKECVQTNS